MNKTISSQKVNRYIKMIINEIRKCNPNKIILFGSRARGNYKKQSDIAVDINLSLREKRKLKEKIDEISGLYSIDLVFLPEVSEDFKKRILKEGIILYEKK